MCALTWAACTQQRQPCLTPKIATLIIESIHLKTDTSTIPVDTLIPAAVFIPIVPGRDTEQVTTYPAQALFSISLSPDSTVCRWAFSTDSLKNVGLYIPDTLTFFYKRKLQFLSNACGYTYFYSLDSVHTNASHTIIDSLHILNSSVTNNVNTKHVQIFIHHNF